MTSWLDELDAAAAHAMLGDAVAPYGGLRSVHVRPERIRALIACVRAADAMRNNSVKLRQNGTKSMAHRATYDAARAALDEPEPDDTTKAAIAGVKELAKQFETRLKGPKP